MDCHFPIGPIPDMQSHIINELGNLIVFFRQPSLCISLERHQTKVPASSPCSMHICDLSLNIAFIQSSTLHDLFSLALCNLVFFCLGVNAGFRLAFLYVNLISFSRFLTVLSHTLTPVSTHLFFISFVVRFLFSWQIALSFLP